MSPAARIVFVHSSDELYGADRMLLEMLDALPAAMRAAAEVWVPTDLPHPAHPLCHELEGRGIAVRHLSLPIMRRAYRTAPGLGRLGAQWLGVVRALRAQRPAMVYCTTSAALLMASAARAARVPRVVAHVQETWSSSDRRALAPLARAADTLVAISAPVASSLPDALRARTVVVPNATPDPGPAWFSSGSSVSPDSGALTFVVASRWNRWKGHATLLQAWDRLDQPGRLVVLGGPPPSGDAVPVRELVAALRHPGSVDVVGEVSDPSSYLAAADVVLVPSDEPEPFGLVAIEAFARGRPVVASDGGGLAEIVDDGTTGWLFPPGDSAALAAVLGRLTHADAERAGRLARERYEQAYTPAVFGAAWRAAVGIRGDASGPS